MTVEEALLAVMGLVALVLLFLGLAEALEGDPRARLRARRRRLSRRAPTRPASRSSAPTSPRPREEAPAAPTLVAGSVQATGERTAAVVEAEAAPAPGGTADAEGLVWRERVATHVRRREFGEARGLLEPVLASGDLTIEGAEFLLEVCSAAIARDLWRLRRALRRESAEETSLSAALGATRLLLESAPAAGLAAAPRQRAGRRLWRGHTRLGLRRWRSGDFEAAVQTLFQALSVPDLDGRRRRLARDLLVRTLEDAAGQSLELIPQLRGDGDRAAALEQAQRVIEQIQRAREEGVPAEDLAVATSRARQLLEHIEHSSVQ